MLDINGLKIEVGQIVKTAQPSGGILTPAKPETGEVIELKDAFGKTSLAISYYKKYRGVDIECKILLLGKINEIVSNVSNTNT